MEGNGVWKLQLTTATFVFGFFILVIGQNLPDNDREVVSNFRDFIKKYNKSYCVGSDEYFRRLEIFRSTIKLSSKLNSFRDHPDSASYGINKFSDLTDEEFREKYLSGLKLSTEPMPQKGYAQILSQNTKNVPQKFDWRNAGVITQPRDQKECGSCWAFSSVEMIESMYAMKKKPLVPLSVQQMVDCSYHFVPSLKGCDGGLPCDALAWALKTRTVFVPEAVYPYVAEVQRCRSHPEFNRTMGPVVTNYTCYNFVKSELSMLEKIVSVGPIAVSVDASNWKNYHGGVIKFHCGELPLNHAVQIVGYDLTAPIPYYIVKNSWGTDFGNAGYVYVKYGENVCSIAKYVSTAEVS